MYDILPKVSKWVEDGQTAAMATVIRTWGSSPRQAGAKMAVNQHGEMTGSVSGGCVEGAVVEAALETLQTGQAQYLHFGVADETAWEVGLACGGMVDVFVQPLDPEIFRQQRNTYETDAASAHLVQVKGPPGTIGRQWFSLLDNAASYFHDSGIPSQVADAASSAMSSRVIDASTQEGGEVEFFLDIQLPKPLLIIVGGVHISVALISMAASLGYRTVVIDPRRAFGSEARFAHADRLIHEWPDIALEQIPINRSTAIAVLTHDPKLDDPALIKALQSNAFYVGALGSRTTQEKRRERLRDVGITEDQLGRLYGPIGLDLGGRSPEEIALSIMGEIVRVRNSL